MARLKNNIWLKTIKILIEYMLEEKYSLNDTGIVAIKLVDEVDDINPNVNGNYVVKSDLKVYDQDKVFVYELLPKDQLIIKSINYFIAESDSSLHELGKKWNNTRIGDHGVVLEVGEQHDKHAYTTPSIVFKMLEEDDIDILETKNVNTLKTFEFLVGMVVQESDLYDRTQAYAETERVEEIFADLVYDFYQSSRCRVNEDVSGRLQRWVYKTSIVSEDERPLIISKINNKVYYR